MPRPVQSITFVASESQAAQEAAHRLSALYGNDSEENADVVVALGGDGFMLQTLHRFMGSGIPIYGMNKGTIGFLMNEFREDGLRERLGAAIENAIHPLTMTAVDAAGKTHKALAINEVAIFRQSYQAARLRISIDGKVRLDELVCDGVMVATPIGSTAYNLSAQGPIIPVDAPLLALTPVSPFRPRRWRGALLPNHQTVEIIVLEPEKRPVNAVADATEVKSVHRITICESLNDTGLILFDHDHSWDERILAEQFRY
ncbi:NAD kinase [Aurantimonas marianensis]|uniref:NAD kinase n=1 Tax=Aurantimonas marianensis TaxID=2920428 RepID=A0A9X2HEF8_9HYPH|nr:NAD kinase [Aurantimonas marianensis]MCP3055499.1 NAD kinase [Aurantimonas marianensis]